MNLARAFTAMVSLAVVAVLFAVVALGTTLRSADASVVGRAHGLLGIVARRISAAYSAQITTLRSDLAVPLPLATLDGYGRRVVSATIGDNEGVDGGLFLDAGGIVADAPQRVANARERTAIAALARSVERGGALRFATVALPGGDLVAIDAVPLTDRSGVAWARERISASVLHGAQALTALIAAAVACSLALVGIGAWIVWIIRRDAKRVLVAIGALEADPAAHPQLPRGDFGAIARAVTTMSERRAAAEALAQRSERLAAIGRLAANAAHEIRNPLNALRLQVDLLRRRLGNGLDEPAAKLRAEIERLDAVVNGMLAVGSDGPVAANRLDLRDVAERAIDALEADALVRARTIRFACTATDTIVYGDEGRLVQLAINILANAIDAAPPQSMIEVKVSPGPMLSIADTGGGIAERDTSQVFEPFYTTKPAGTGLGLAIAHEIAHAHGAAIAVHSAPGRTEFRIGFPGERHG
ncbi:MAG: HAMP domain-containing histidine kinase [Candidatus Eremiobacteraeota bacterium]|nr:HAMP domain-containing histidine kinase [Candidatus Eremiobacteraeota bacterium]MBC5820974.1 HAMP domain-containing histidine kinase [Candidatus Eremiobacteraeota bacterium]